MIPASSSVPKQLQGSQSQHRVSCKTESQLFESSGHSHVNSSLVRERDSVWSRDYQSLKYLIFFPLTVPSVWIISCRQITPIFLFIQSHSDGHESHLSSCVSGPSEQRQVLQYLVELQQV